VRRECAGSVFAKSLKSAWVKLCIENSVLNVLMPQVALNGPSVLAPGSKRKALRVPQHVRVNGEFKAGLFGRRGDNCSDLAVG
jgi:hypothetical protein